MRVECIISWAQRTGLVFFFSLNLVPFQRATAALSLSNAFNWVWETCFPGIEIVHWTSQLFQLSPTSLYISFQAWQKTLGLVNLPYIWKRSLYREWFLFELCTDWMLLHKDLLLRTYIYGSEFLWGLRFCLCKWIPFAQASPSDHYLFAHNGVETIYREHLLHRATHEYWWVFVSAQIHLLQSDSLGFRPVCIQHNIK